jgi:osmoprotectant transport system permease protein
MFPDENTVLYPKVSLFRMLGQHLGIIVTASLASGLTGIFIGIAVTRKKGRAFLPLVREVSSLAQTIPPVTILALAVPLAGFGFKPAIIALFLYSLLPVIYNTIAAFENIPDQYIEAGRASGLNSIQILLNVELPIAADLIFTGIRMAIVINTGTAAIGAIVGAGGFGVIIIGGIVDFNKAFLFSGALTTVALALFTDAILGIAQSRVYSARKF